MVVLVLWRLVRGCVGIVEVGTWLCWYCGGWYVVVLVLRRLTLYRPLFNYCASSRDRSFFLGARVYGP